MCKPGPHPDPLPQAGEGERPPRPHTREGRVEGGARVAQMTSAQLFGSALEVQIDHHGAVYRLKQTSLGKLILTK